MLTAKFRYVNCEKRDILEGIFPNRAKPWSFTLATLHPVADGAHDTPVFAIITYAYTHNTSIRRYVYTPTDTQNVKCVYVPTVESSYRRKEESTLPVVVTGLPIQYATRGARIVSLKCPFSGCWFATCPVPIF